MVADIGLFESPDLTSLHFCFWGGLIKGEVYKRKVDTRDELLARIMGNAARIKIFEGQFRRTARYVRTVAANFII